MMDVIGPTGKGLPARAYRQGPVVMTWSDALAGHVHTHEELSVRMSLSESIRQ
jgi:hypothetical protein